MKFPIALRRFCVHSSRVDAPLTPEEREEVAMGIEDFTGKPSDAGSAQANLAAVRRRIAYLTREMDTLQENEELTHRNELVAEYDRLKADLTKARELAANYESQLKSKN